jgi:hypothetical protein
MKNLVMGMGLMVILSFTVFSCNKVASKTPTSKGSSNAVLSLSQSEVSKGQPLIASLPAGANAAAVKWWVSTNTLTHITQASGQAMILFSNTGVYRITAAYATADSVYSDTATASVTVNDTTYSPPPVNLDTSSLAGDLITLTPSFDSLGNLLFTAQTRNSYGCEPYLVSLLYDAPAPGGQITVNFYEVISNSTGNCNGIANPAIAFEFTNTAVYSDGTWPITVNVAGTPYTGSLTIAGGSYSFTWNYTSGVVISPLQLYK